MHLPRMNIYSIESSSGEHLCWTNLICVDPFNAAQPFQYTACTINCWQFVDFRSACAYYAFNILCVVCASAAFESIFQICILVVWCIVETGVCMHAMAPATEMNMKKKITVEKKNYSKIGIKSSCVDIDGWGIEWTAYSSNSEWEEIAAAASTHTWRVHTFTKRIHFIRIIHSKLNRFQFMQAKLYVLRWMRA